MLLPEDLLQLGTADEVFPADILDGHITADMCFQIVHDLNISSGAASARSPDLLRRFHRVGKISPDHTEKQKFQIKPDQLLGAKGCILLFLHFLEIGIIQRGLDAASRLGDHLS